MMFHVQLLLIVGIIGNPFVSLVFLKGRTALRGCQSNICSSAFYIDAHRDGYSKVTMAAFSLPMIRKV